MSDGIFPWLIDADASLAVAAALSPVPVFALAAMGLQNRTARRRAILVAPPRHTRVVRRFVRRRASPSPAQPGTNEPSRSAVVAASLLLGIGLGGFVDCILFHQILPLHAALREQMPSAVRLHGELNLLWDGLFHTLTWLMTAIGLGLLWQATRHRDAPHPTRMFLGGLALGWGLFNCVEGIRTLGVHRILESSPHLVGDGLFLASGAPLVVLGWLLIRLPRDATLRPPPQPFVLQR